MTRRVVITGTVPDSRRLSPAWRNDDRFEIWSFNADYDIIGRSARHFEMHDLAVYGDAAVDDSSPQPDYLRMLHEGIGRPVYMRDSDPAIPGCVAYPIDLVRARFGDYFTNTISYMLALAIVEMTPVGPETPEIHLYGIDMALEHEAAWERPSVEYFIGWARGAGIGVVIPDESDLLKCIGLYGYDDVYERESQIREWRGDLRSRAERFERAAERYRGAAENCDWFLRRGFLSDSDGARAATAKLQSRKAWLLGMAKRYEDSSERDPDLAEERP